VFHTVFGDDLEVHDALRASDVEAWDSLAHVNLMFALEEAFAIQFSGEEFANFEDVGALRRHLEERLGP
jgi:acyl carrier protein